MMRIVIQGKKIAGRFLFFYEEKNRFLSFIKSIKDKMYHVLFQNMYKKKIEFLIFMPSSFVY